MGGLDGLEGGKRGGEGGEASITQGLPAITRSLEGASPGQDPASIVKGSLGFHVGNMWGAEAGKGPGGQHIPWERWPHQAAGRGGGEKGPESGEILEVEPPGAADRLTDWS